MEKREILQEQKALQLLSLLQTEGPLSEEGLRRILASENICPLGEKGNNIFTELVNTLRGNDLISISTEGIFSISRNGRIFLEENDFILARVISPFKEQIEEQIQRIQAIIELLSEQIEIAQEIAEKLGKDRERLEETLSTLEEVQSRL
ncbi:hypothetical protein J7K05_01710 [bacterium]|nr:hypothetical protein [bacterium]